MTLFILLLCFAVAYLVSGLVNSAGTIWRRLTRASRTRRNLRLARAKNEAQMQLDAQESELLRERLIGGANVIAMLDASNVDSELVQVAA